MLPVLQLALSIQEQCLLLLVPSQNCNTVVLLLNSIKQVKTRSTMKICVIALEYKMQLTRRNSAANVLFMEFGVVTCYKS